MFYYSIAWYVFCIVSGFGCFVYNLGEISNGNSKKLIRFIGGILFFSFIIISFFMYSWQGGLALIVVQLIVSLPIHIAVNKIYSKLLKLLNTDATD